MNPVSEVIQSLREHLALGRELLGLIEQEARQLKKSGEPALEEVCQSKKTLLQRLNDSLDKLRRHRLWWQRLSPGERTQHPEVAALLRQNQDQIMKLLLLDRENEQSLLRRGLVPARELSAVAPQRPHYVAGLYRRQGAGVS